MTLDLPSRPPGWLTDRPVAHRGLHRLSDSIPENSLAAARAAIEHRFAIECDVQRSSDDDAMVFHDFELDRLTAGSGPIASLRASDIEALELKRSSERIPRFSALLSEIGGRVPLICEIKSRFNGDMRLTDRTLALLADYAGPVAVKSFDPAVISHLRHRGFARPLGIVAEAAFDDAEWDALPASLRRSLANVLHFAETRPDFLSYHVNDLPHAVPYLCRSMLHLPVLAWTVRTPEQVACAAEWADQMVFEGFLP